MNQARQRKLIFLVIIALIVGGATALVLYALGQNISLFYSPTQIAAGEAPLNHPIRVGGMVVAGSIERGDDLSVRFQVTDYQHTLNITYRGILPDLFREGQGVVALGRLTAPQQIEASEILAKHDENYMPPEVTQALSLAGRE